MDKKEAVMTGIRVPSDSHIKKEYGKLEKYAVLKEDVESEGQSGLSSERSTWGDSTSVRV